MCDTFVSVSDRTKDGSVIFGKNSDRQPNEPQIIEYVEGGEQSDETVKCTYIDVPQRDHINSVLLSRPIWIWGAEMGTNDKGVVIGNEAVWTNEQENSQKLIGMDLLRLGLERSNTAREAVSTIAELLQEYGQGGNCGMYSKEFYDNSFIIADSKEAWVLETAGRYWIAEKVKGIRTISNILTIEKNYDLIHPELLQHTIETGRCRDEDDFNFREQYKTKFMSFATMGDKRRACTLKVLNEEGKVTVSSAMNALRNHNTEKEFNPQKSSMASPCVHASSLLTPSQSTSSMVSHITENSIHWLTGTSTPCLSVFKPFEVKPFDNSLMNATRNYSSGSLWWEHERLQRKAVMNYKQNAEIITNNLRKIEGELISSIYETNPPKIRTNEALKRHFDAIIDLQNKVMEEKGGLSQLRYRRFWNSKSKKVNLPPL